MDRVAIAAALREIGTRLQMQRQSPHRARAYKKGAEALDALERNVASLIREGSLTEMPGIGSALARTITELAQTGLTFVEGSPHPLALRIGLCQFLLQPLAFALLGA